MARLIDADALSKKWQDMLDIKTGEKEEIAVYKIFEILIKRLSQEPTIDAASVVHGEWIELHEENGHEVGTCSHCRHVRIVDNYCPNCGALMDDDCGIQGYPLNDDRCAGCPLDGHCEFVKCWKREGMQNVLDKQDKS